MSKQELAGSTVTAALLATTGAGGEDVDVFTKGCGDTADPEAEADIEDEGSG